MSAGTQARIQADPIYSTGLVKGFRPVLDGKLLTEAPTVSLLAGRFADVPVIVGYVAATAHAAVPSPDGDADAMYA